MVEHKYTVFLVDDERRIREGISQLIEWERLGLALIGTAADGLTAYEQLMQLKPDIIVTDIKMPNMDGLELIERTAELLPESKYIVLSGHGEFEYASRAMQFGVKHYLLKPCDETEITAALQQIADELNEARSRSSFYEKIEKQLAEALPKVREQLLRDCLLNKSYFKSVMSHYKEILHIHDEEIRLLLFQMEANFEYIELYALKQISEELLQAGRIMLSTIVGDKFIILVEKLDMSETIEFVTRIKKTFEKLYRIGLTVSISDTSTFEQIPSIYQKAQEYLEYRFYLGEGSIITSDETGHVWSNANAADDSMNYMPIVMAIKIGKLDALEAELAMFFDKLREQQSDNVVATSYCIELMTTIIRETVPDKVEENIAKLIPIMEMTTLGDIHKYIYEVAYTITQENYKLYSQKNRMLVHDMVRRIKENLGNEELSIQWLSKNYFFMNADYLGKLFRKEMNEKFSQYVTRLRLEWAKELMENHNHSKVYEIAEKVGFGHDPQYFSNIFKKHTGMSPMEYKSMQKKDTHY